MAANPRAPDARALALVAVAVGRTRGRCWPTMRFEERRVGRAGRSGGRRCRTARSRLAPRARPILAHAANRLRRERRRGARSGRTPRRPGPRVGPCRDGVPRRAPSGPSAADLPACDRVDAVRRWRWRGGGEPMPGYVDVRRQPAARPVPRAAGPDGRRSMARSRDHRPAGRDTAAGRSCGAGGPVSPRNGMAEC